MKLNWKKIIGGAVGAAAVAGGASYTAQPGASLEAHGGVVASAVLAYLSGLFTKRPQDTAK
jgi:hypothetical protein